VIASGTTEYAAPAAVSRAPEPPLMPTPDEARDALRRELVDPQYVDQDLVQRILDWIERRIDGTVEGASAVPALSWLAATVIAVALGTGLLLLLSRARLTARRRDAAGAVLTDDGVTAAELRARAEQARSEGRYAEAVVDGFRALAVHQVERGRLDNAPGSTAREVAGTLAEHYPQQREQVEDGARLFDAVMYGERPATLEEADAVLAIDAQLRVRR
jgi:hypothetical protein